MKAPETKTEGLPDDAPFEVTWEEGGLDAQSPEAVEVTARDALADRRPSLWDALVGWGYSEPALVPQPASRWLLDEEDFSAEHGYEPGFEGRSEFEHGDFERWT